MPESMVKGRTVLIQKDPANGTVASNYRPIACLPLMWKLLTGVLVYEPKLGFVAKEKALFCVVYVVVAL